MSAKAIRQALKSELSITSKEVSVRTQRGGSYRLNILTAKVDAAKVKEIASRFESVRYCEATGYMLSGGNTFVFVTEYQPMDAVEMTVENTATRAKMYGSTPGGWFERYFPTVAKAEAFAGRKGWAVNY